MDKKEFLEKLALALAGQVPRQVIEENIQYYDDYIAGDIAKYSFPQTRFSNPFLKF